MVKYFSRDELMSSGGAGSSNPPFYNVWFQDKFLPSDVKTQELLLDEIHIIQAVVVRPSGIILNCPAFSNFYYLSSSIAQDILSHLKSVITSEANVTGNVYVFKASRDKNIPYLGIDEVLEAVWVKRTSQKGSTVYILEHIIGVEGGDKMPF